MTRLRIAGSLIACLPGAAIAAVTCNAPNSTGYRLCQIDAAAYPTASCNDHTKPAFWVHPGSGMRGGQTRWLFWLEGGGDCVDSLSCAARAQMQGTRNQFLLTSTGFVAPSSSVGILSTNPTANPDLFDANIVFVHYCSSDDWSGAKTGAGTFSAGNLSTWSFQGRANALAAMGALPELGSPLDFSAAKQVIFGGSSAGGEGISVTVNQLRAMLPASVQQTAFINDAGFGLDIGAYDAHAPSPYVNPGMPTFFEQKFITGMATWNGMGDPVCDAAAATPQQKAACYNSALLLQQGYITLPAFVAESQIDTAQISQELCPTTYGVNCKKPPCSPSMQATYVSQAFAPGMAANLSDPNSVNPYSVFSPDAYQHVLLASSSFSTPFGFPGQGSGTEIMVTPQGGLHLWLLNMGSRMVGLGNAPGVPSCSR